ncbi:ferric citrate uptake sigma factor FecI [Raoultella ornithinolytica]|uniref:ferric citrate uptake sigma factor FecI n=1 Tax=Raoultella ornithinolytica TaxID=54291 RepID=UPI0008F56D67|nr:ferric citrate uptake sigma factor FecI [Raoultella ornithinolytica]APB05454.1 sigma-70 family RNA polymerase sigma factor [Raoultella ornithinolytica]
MSQLSATTPFTLASLYQAHHGWLTTWLTGKLQSAFDADDVTQDTFLRVMGSESLTAIRDPRSFLCTIARRVMIDLFRRNVLERAWLEMLAQLPQALVPSPERQHIQLETLQQVDAMLDGLSRKARAAFLLSQLEGLTYAEIAERLMVSVSSVKKYVARATEHCLLFRLENGL